LVAQGKRVGVTATGHKVIANLLRAVAHEAESRRQALRLAHKGDADDEAGDDAPDVRMLQTNEQAAALLAAKSVDRQGGTPWLWSRPAFRKSVDVLFIDEAGQMSLANALAVSGAANSLVLLGDPQQLDQPRKGTHPEGVGISALEHLLAGHTTMPPERGEF